jgi:hypothetical protein
VNKFLHWLSHLTGRYTGNVVSWTDAGRTMVGYECNHCHRVSGVVCADPVIDRELKARGAQPGGGDHG